MLLLLRLGVDENSRKIGTNQNVAVKDGVCVADIALAINRTYESIVSAVACRTYFVDSFLRFLRGLTLALLLLHTCLVCL